MKVTITKGPMFKKVEENAYRYLSEVLRKQAKQKKEDSRKSA